MKSFTGLLLASSLTIGIFFGCSKADNGATGPQGQTGSQGSQGNANVKAIRDSVNSAAGWSYPGGPYWYTFFANPYINSTFLKSGGFAEVFLSTNNGVSWTALPATYPGTPVTAQWTYSYTSISSGIGVYIYFTWNDQLQHTDPYTTYGATAYFNVVCITASVVNKYPNTNWSNYEALMQIPELRQQLNQN